MRNKTISKAEWEVMEVIWKDPPKTARQVIDLLSESRDWKPQTVKTLLARLTKKGALTVETEGNRYWYFPAVSRGEAIAEETDSFLSRVCRGSLAPMLTHLIESRERLSAEEIEALRELLEKKGSDS